LARHASAVAARELQAIVSAPTRWRTRRRSVGQPGCHDKAVQQLRSMRGRAVRFHTAVAVSCVSSGFLEQALVTVTVRFRLLDDREIERYLLLEQPYDCAGSAKCETLGIVLAEAIESDDPTALVGLPLIRTSAMLRAAGLDPLAVAA
jgi:septum formation protein